MTVYITKDQFGFKYKTEINSSRWAYFPETVKDAASISKYFEQGRHQPAGGKHDPPVLDFRDENFKPVVYFTVSKDRKTAIANYDTGKRVNIDSKDLATELEIHDFLRPRCQFALEEDLKKLNDLSEQTKLLTSKASTQALADLHNNLATDTAIEYFLSNHAKNNSNSATIIEFTE